MVYYINAGGPVMYILLCISIVLVAISLEKFAYIYKHYPNDTNKLYTYEDIDAEEFRLKKNLDVIGLIVTISPLLGLLGTIIGMMTSFNSLNSNDGLAAMMGGVSEALIATGFGLSIAIVALFIHAILANLINRILFILETECGEPYEAENDQ